MKNTFSVIVVRFQSSHSPSRLNEICNEYLESFRCIPGLIQKYYLAEENTGYAAGIYLFESDESRDAYLNSDLASRIPEIFGVVLESIRIERYKVSEILNQMVPH